ncbi:MAG: hypothetical protein ACK6D3_10530 [Planctomycetaceae bacterium]
MKPVLSLPVIMCLGLVLCWQVTGCGRSETAPPQRADTTSKEIRTTTTEERPAPAKGQRKTGGSGRRRARSLELSGDSAAQSSSGQSGGQLAEAELAQLQPFQVLLGNWRWVTQKKFGDFPKTGDDVRWAWNFQKLAGHPALVTPSDDHPYYRELALLSLADDRFEARLQLGDDSTRVLQGTWLEGHAPRELADGKILQRTFKLGLDQVSPTTGDQWQMTIALLDNDQYLVEIKRRASAAATPQSLDTVRQQRLGTSFAVAESDNPGPKCIVSGGLGTMTVSFDGKNYPVCCSGCAAAFNDDPQRWLSRLKLAPAQPEQ